MSEIVTTNYIVDDIFDVFLADKIEIKGETGVLQKITTPDFPFLRRYCALVKDFFSPEQINLLDKRLRRIAEKREFSFTGTLADMIICVDINAKVHKSHLVGFKFNVYTTNSIIKSDIEAYSTEELRWASFYIVEKETEGSLQDAVRSIWNWLEVTADPDILFEFFKEIVKTIADNTEITYEYFVAGTDEQNNTPITVIPGIEKRGGEKRE